MRSFLVIVYFFVTPGTPVKSLFIQISFLAQCSTMEIVFQLCKVAVSVGTVGYESVGYVCNGNDFQLFYDETDWVSIQ